MYLRNDNTCDFCGKKIGFWDLLFRATDVEKSMFQSIELVPCKECDKKYKVKKRLSEVINSTRKEVEKKKMEELIQFKKDLVAKFKE